LKPSQFAFTASVWGDSAVVCRAYENCPGPIVEQEFGVFETWTEAEAFANALNEGLEIDALTARQIVTSSILGTCEVLGESFVGSTIWSCAPVVVEARELQVRCACAQLDLALTFCRLARDLGSDSRKDRMIRKVRRVMDHAVDIAFRIKMNSPYLPSICSRLNELDEELKALPPEVLQIEFS
jgi:hypothetical protein